jgi:anti-sigma-K factor RskA
LWIIPPDGKPLATPGTQVPDATGKLVLQAPIPQGVQLATAAVTIEDAAGSPVPTSPVQFAGKVTQ